MGDLLGRLGAIAAGSGPLLAPRPRARFEPRSDDAPGWLGEQDAEVEAAWWRPATGGSAPSPPSRAVPPAPPEPPAPGKGVPGPARRGDGPPADGDAVNPPVIHAEPGSEQVDAGRTRRAGDEPVTVPAAPAPETVVHRHDTVREVHVHEVARTERIERASEVVELLHWIEAGDGDGEDVPGPLPAAAAPAPTVPADGAGQSRRPPVSAPVGNRSPAAVVEVPAPVDVAPAITVTIGRVEVRTIEERNRPAPRAPAPAPARLRFAGPSLDEFLGSET